MKAFLGTPVSKTQLLQSLAAHRESYSLSPDVFDYWKDGYGCAIGCSLRNFAPGSEWDEDLFQPLFGIPSGLASRMELFFHELGYTESLYWPERFVSAIRPGSDLRDVSAMFGLWRAESGYAPPSAMADRLILEIERAGCVGEHDEAVFQEERVW